MPLQATEHVCKTDSSKSSGSGDSGRKKTVAGSPLVVKKAKHRRAASTGAFAAALLCLVTLFSSILKGALAQQEQTSGRATAAAAPSRAGRTPTSAGSEGSVQQQLQQQTGSYLQPLCSATINYGASIGDNTKQAAAEVPIFVGSFSVLAQGLEQASPEVCSLGYSREPCRAQ